MVLLPGLVRGNRIALFISMRIFTSSIPSFLQPCRKRLLSRADNIQLKIHLLLFPFLLMYSVKKSITAYLSLHPPNQPKTPYLTFPFLFTLLPPVPLHRAPEIPASPTLFIPKPGSSRLVSLAYYRSPIPNPIHLNIRNYLFTSSIEGDIRLPATNDIFAGYVVRDVRFLLLGLM